MKTTTPNTAPSTPIEPFTGYTDKEKRLFIILDMIDEQYPHPQVIKDNERLPGGTVWLMNATTEERVIVALPEFKRYIKEGLMVRNAKVKKQ